MTHEQTETSIRLFAREVLPRLREATRERTVQEFRRKRFLWAPPVAVVSADFHSSLLLRRPD